MTEKRATKDNQHSVEVKTNRQEGQGGRNEVTPVTPRHRDDQGGMAPYAAGFQTLARRMRDEFDRIFDDFFRGRSLASQGSQLGWGVDVDDRENEIVVRAEAPGFEPDDFDLQVRGDQLVLKAARKTEAEDKEHGTRQWGRQELYQTLPLPPNGIDKDRIEAQYRNGILTITLPKTEEGKGRRINVKS